MSDGARRRRDRVARRVPALTALDNLIAPVLPYRTGWDKRERGRALLAAVGLAGREQSLAARMSGGEQQRVAIARALVNTRRAQQAEYGLKRILGNEKGPLAIMRA